MKQRITWYTILTIGTGALAGCGDQATEPDPPGATANSATAAAIGSDRWIARADMPSDRAGLAVAVLGNGSGKSVVYAIAGFDTKTGYATKMVQAYDVSTNTWSFKANYPEPERVSLTNGTGIIDGKIYVSGGTSGSQYVSRALYQYNPSTNVWTRKHDLPAPSFYGVTGVIGDKLYVLTACEWVSVCPLGKAFWRYAPGTDSWTSLPTPPSSHSAGAGAVIGGKFYVVGGGSIDEAGGLAAGTKLDVFDPATNQWTTLPGLTGIRHSAASAALGGKLYVIGGTGYDTTTSRDVLLVSVKVYDPATNRWTTAHQLPAPGGVRAAGKVMVNGQARIELVGGSRPGNNLQYIP